MADNNKNSNEPGEATDSLRRRAEGARGMRRSIPPLNDDHRPVAPQGGRGGQGHGPDHICRRPRAASHGLREAPAIAPPARSRPASRCFEGGGPAGRPCHPRGERAAHPLRHPAGEPGRACPGPRQGPLRGRPGGRGGRPRRRDRRSRLQADRRRLRGAARPHVDRRGPGPARCAHPRLRAGGQRPQGSLVRLRRRGGGLRARPTTSARRRSSSRATPTCPWSSTPRWPRSAPTAS